jgi:very-short-patch-repair endonuclease
MNAHHDQELLIRSETQRSRKRMPLRKLFAQAGDVLTTICPCWMASPLSVSQLLDGGRRHFDVVVFDEASQVLPEDAVCAILRGDKLVVAGDRNQLPPSRFFAASDEDLDSEEETGAAEGFESLLDMANAFLPSSYLDWHYRSRDESLIAFSNRHIYSNRLVTFPGPGGPPAISHDLVTQRFGADGEEESCGAEVQRVVELVMEHARSRPQETLGVITMGVKHRDRVQLALDKGLQDHAGLEEFFDESKSERFFVKNLESVQGDERDAIIISIGYGKDRAGNLPFRFGPLIPEGGRRRLNVAITRARQRVTLVSAFSHLDMDMRRVRPGSGVELLRNYIEYAASNGKRLGDTTLSDVAPNDFEQDIQDALEARGLRLIPQLGASQYRIDIVAEHPRKPGRYVLAIECDGATYHSSNTARDRDRIRQHQLEALGWRFHRIWSTDWFMHKSEEVERAVKAFDQAVEWADKIDVIGTSASLNRDTRPDGDGANHTQESSTVQPNRSNGRGLRPFVIQRSSITEYSSKELIRLISWVASDGQLRTDDEVMKEMIEVLGFKRRGARIELRLHEAIQQWRK